MPLFQSLRLHHTRFYNMLPVVMTQSTISSEAADGFTWHARESTDNSRRDTTGSSDRVSVEIGDLSGWLDLHRPQQGIQLSGCNAAAELLAVRLPDTPANQFVDGWVRGGDAVAIHEPRNSRRLRATALWRLATGPADLTVELVLSVQTSAIRSDGAVAVDCRLPATEVIPGISSGQQLEWLPPIPTTGGAELPWRRLADAAVLCLLFRQSLAGRSFAICVRRDEGREVALQRCTLPERPEPPNFTLTTWFFPTLIEKGVLHRSRLAVTLGSPANDLDWAAAAAQSLASQPPLLQ
jgi:hypothetical protein